MEIKLTVHAARGVFVVGTPGSHVQRQPRTYRSLERALDRVRALAERRAS